MKQINWTPFKRLACGLFALVLLGISSQVHATVLYDSNVSGGSISLSPVNKSFTISAGTYSIGTPSDVWFNLPTTWIQGCGTACNDLVLEMLDNLGNDIVVCAFQHLTGVSGWIHLTGCNVANITSNAGYITGLLHTGWNQTQSLGSILADPSNTLPEIIITDNSSFDPSIPSNARTHFISIAPINNSVTTSTSTTITLQAYISAMDMGSSTFVGDTVKFHSYISGVDTAFTAPSFDDVISVYGATTTSYTLDLPHSGTYHVYASILSLDTTGMIDQVFTSTTTNFTFNMGFYESVYGTTTADELGIPKAPCGISDLTGCVQNALVFLFYPSKSSLDMYQQFKDTLYQKPPVGYFVIIKRNLDSINASSTGSILGWNIPQGIKDQFFTPIKVAVGAIIGWFGLIHLYRRFKDVQL